MLEPGEAMTQQALEQGRRNEEAIVLIKKHCAHARVELSPHMGHSMVEDMTGLPISGREMRCEHGRPPTSVSWDLRSNAIAFYESNCIDCPHRQVQAIPNLKTVAENVLENRRRDQEREAAAHQHRQRAHALRAQRRAALVASEPPATRAMVALLDGMDADSPDRRADEFVDLCRLNPELCTERAADVLLDAVAEITEDRLFAGLRFLDDQRRLDRGRLLAVAVAALSQRPIRQCATIVVDLRSGLVPGQLIPALGSIVRMAAPVPEFGREPRAELAPLRLAAEAELPALLDVLGEGLADESKNRRRTAAAGAQRLIEIEPSVAQVLVFPLVDAWALPGSLDDYMGDPRGDLTGALYAALVADPERTALALESRGSSAPPPVRDALFHVFDATVRNGRDGTPGTRHATDLALDAAFRRLSGDWGRDIVRAAADMIELASRWEQEAMAGRVDQLFGALLALTAAPFAPPTDLRVPDELPATFRAMQVQSERLMRSAAIRQLREALGNLVAVAPEAVARNVFSVIEAGDLESDDAKDLRDEAVRLLGDLGRRPDLLPDVLPALWTALVHADQRVRANAIRAWREVSAITHRQLPPDLGELLPTLLSDPYVVVHQEAVRALRRGLAIPESLRDRIVTILLLIAEHYKTEDASLLDDIVHVVWNQTGHLSKPLSSAVRERCLALAQHLDRYDKERFIGWVGRSEISSSSYILRLIEVAGDPRREMSSQRDDEPLRRLRELPAGDLQPHLQLILGAARQHLPGNTWQAMRFIELLQRCGSWSMAAEFADELVGILPDDAEHALQRDGLIRLRALCRVQNALVDGRESDAQDALDDCIAADNRVEAAIAEQRHSWDADE